MGIRVTAGNRGRSEPPDRLGLWVVLALGVAAFLMIVLTVTAIVPAAAEVGVLAIIALTLAWGLGFVALAALAGLGIERWWKRPRHPHHHP